MGRQLIAVAVLAGSLGLAAADDPMSRIREADLKADLFTMAGDAMRGREGGTLDELSASMWVAERARQAGLEPAGDNGTYFQFFPLERFRVSAGSQVAFGDKKLVMGRDVLPDNTVLAFVDAPIVTAAADAVASADVTAKALVVRYVPDPSAPASTAPRPDPARRSSSERGSATFSAR